MVETFMCSNQWTEIEFGDKVPLLCMDRQKHAFLNENKKGVVSHPDDASRIACREKLLAYIVDKGINALKQGQTAVPTRTRAAGVACRGSFAVACTDLWDPLQNSSRPVHCVCVHCRR